MATKKHPTKKIKTKSDQIYMRAQKRRKEHRDWYIGLLAAAENAAPKGFTWLYNFLSADGNWYAVCSKKIADHKWERVEVFIGKHEGITVAEGVKFADA